MRILLVDDEAALTESLGQALVRDGYQVEIAMDGETGSRLAEENRFNLLILDWMLPGCSGLDICKKLRSQGVNVPVLFLTAKDTVDDRVLGLDAGADDYLVKPFELRELLARVRALLRRKATETETHRLTVGGLELDSDAQVVFLEGKAIALSEKEVRLLGYLMQNPGQLLTHDQIQQAVWPMEQKPSSNVLAALMRLLRRKLEGGDGLIQTVYGRGYCFVAESTGEP
ncbi:MAG: two-component system response regulator RppA [Cyanobacteria bacterium P01_H01_bin.15]